MFLQNCLKRANWFSCISDAEDRHLWFFMHLVITKHGLNFKGIYEYWLQVCLNLVCFWVAANDLLSKFMDVFFVKIVVLVRLWAGLEAVLELSQKLVCIAEVFFGLSLNDAFTKDDACVEGAFDNDTGAILPFSFEHFNVIVVHFWGERGLLFIEMRFWALISPLSSMWLRKPIVDSDCLVFSKASVMFCLIYSTYYWCTSCSIISTFTFKFSYRFWISFAP